MRGRVLVLFGASSFACGLLGFWAGKHMRGEAAAHSITTQTNQLWAPRASRMQPPRPAAEPGNVAAVLAIRRLEERHPALYEVAKKLAHADLRKALETLKSLTSAHDKAAFLEGLAEVYMRVSPDECLRFLQNLPPSIYKNAGAEKALLVLAESNPGKALELLPTLLRGAEGHNATLKLIDFWTQVDPHAALNWAASHPDPEMRSVSLEQAAATWGHEDPATALAALRQHSGFSAEEASLATRAIIGTWSMSDPKAALDWALQQQRSEHSRELMLVAFMNAAGQDPLHVTTRLQAIGDQSLATEIITGMASQWGLADPSDAANWLSTVPFESAGTGSYLELAQSWSTLDPPSALAWANSLPPDNPARPAAMGEAALAWSRFHPQELQSYLNSLPALDGQRVSHYLNSQARNTPQRPAQLPSLSP